MKTVSINVSSLSVPCANRCRYCLLSWDGHCAGAAYEDCRDYALAFHAWLRENRPELQFQFYFAYSMDHPRLLETVDFMNENGYGQGEFLQFDGMKFRTPEESRRLLQDLKDHGVRLVDFTLYGTRDYHDRFAARQGDFDYMMAMLSQAREVGLASEVGIPLTHENAGQAEPLIRQVQALGPEKIFCFVPHGEGRGAALDKVRFSQADFDSLPQLVKAHFNRDRYRPEGEWVTGKFWEPFQNRVLTVVPTEENLDKLRDMGFARVIASLEALDDRYHNAIAPVEELAERYGDPQGKRFYTQRDLQMHWQRRYISEHGLDLYDIHEERHSFVRRF